MDSNVSRLGRVVKMLTTLQSGKSFNADTLAATLKISKRTIFRDLRDLRKAGIGVYYDDKYGRYAVETDLWPVNGLNDQEALSLLLLVHKANDHIHLPFNNLALLAAQKIEKNLPDEVRRCCDSALQDISVKAYQPLNTSVIDRVFLLLRQAVIKKQAVNIHYYLHDERNVMETQLHPYHLMHVHNDGWYVVGKTNQAGIRTFKLSHIKQLDLLEKFFVKDRRFKIQDYLGMAWAAMPEGTIYEVRLEFASEIARSVAEIKWHKSQKVSFTVDGSAIIEFQVDGLTEIIPWVLSYGDKVKILSPEILRQEIVRITQRAAEQNRTFGYAVAP